MMTGHRVLAILEAKPAAASECSPSPARIDNAWDGRMLQNAEGVSASPLLDDLGLRPDRQGRFATFGFASLTLDRRTGGQLLGWSAGRPRRMVAVRCIVVRSGVQRGYVPTLESITRSESCPTTEGLRRCGR